MITSVAVTLGQGKCLAITTCGHITIEDMKTREHSVIGTASKQTLEALKYAIERLSIHVNK